MDISEVAKRSGFSASAIRYYEMRGLVSSIGRRGIRRVFEPSVLRKPALIGLARRAAFSVEEIATMIGTADRPVLDREMLRAKADQLDAKIAELTLLRDELNKAANCQAPSHMQCPNFMAKLRESERGRTSSRRMDFASSALSKNRT